MFAYIRSNPETKYTFMTTTVATNMRDHCRNQRPLLTGLNPSNPEFAGPLAEIYMREFACTMRTLKQVNLVASKYHEHAFDNTDAYIDDEQPIQLSPHEMTAEQRHATQLLLGVGKSYSEINVALRILDSGSFQASMECSPEMCAKLSQQFSANASMAEDAFDRLNHMTKHVWSMVNLLAFSNLFRFVGHIVLPNPEDSIFIPHIPMHQTPCGFKREFPDEYRAEFSDDESDEDEEKKMNALLNMPQEQPKHFNEIAEQLADEKITPEQACSLIEKLRNMGIIADVMDAQNEQQKCFNEIASGLADWKITTEEACDLFAEWMTEWMVGSGWLL